MTTFKAYLAKPLDNKPVGDTRPNNLACRYMSVVGQKPTWRRDHGMSAFTRTADTASESAKSVKGHKRTWSSNPYLFLFFDWKLQFAQTQKPPKPDT